MKKQLRIDYISHYYLAKLWCFIFGHRFHNNMWNAGGDEMCNRCTKYKNRYGYWTD